MLLTQPLLTIEWKLRDPSRRTLNQRSGDSKQAVYMRNGVKHDAYFQQDIKST